VPAASLPAAEVVPLDERTYIPRNTTALLDAIGRTIDELAERLEKLSESDRPGLVIVAVLTDGLENASKRYQWHEVAARIREQQEKYGWKFLFLGANQDAIETAAKMNIRRRDAATINAPDFDSGSRAVTQKSSIYRSIASGLASPSAFRQAEQPLQELADDEAKKKKKKTSSES